MLDGFEPRHHVRRTAAPHGEFGASALHGADQIVADVGVTGDCRGGQRHRQGTHGRRRVSGFVVILGRPRAYAQYSQGQGVATVVQHDGDLPTGHRSVEEPAADGADHVDGVVPDHLQAVLAEPCAARRGGSGRAPATSHLAALRPESSRAHDIAP